MSLLSFSVFFSVYWTVQEWQTFSSDIFLCELDVIVHSIYMICEGLHFPCFPGVVYIPEPVARSSTCEGNQDSTLHFLHVEVGRYLGHQVLCCMLPVTPLTSSCKGMQSVSSELHLNAQLRILFCNEQCWSVPAQVWLLQAKESSAMVEVDENCVSGSRWSNPKLLWKNGIKDRLPDPG